MLAEDLELAVAALTSRADGAAPRSRVVLEIAAAAAIEVVLAAGLDELGFAPVLAASQAEFVQAGWRSPLRPRSRWCSPPATRPGCKPLGAATAREHLPERQPPPRCLARVLSGWG